MNFLRLPCLKGGGPTDRLVEGFLHITLHLQRFLLCFYFVSLRLCLRQIHLPLGKGGKDLSAFCTYKLKFIGINKRIKAAGDESLPYVLQYTRCVAKLKFIFTFQHSGRSL